MECGCVQQVSESSEGHRQCNCFGSGKEEADGAVITSNYFVSRSPRLGLGPLPLSGRGQELLIKYLRENIFEDFMKITPARLGSGRRCNLVHVVGYFVVKQKVTMAGDGSRPGLVEDVQ